MLCIFFHIFKALFLYTTESYFCVCSDKGNIFFLSFFDSEDFKYIYLLQNVLLFPALKKQIFHFIDSADAHACVFLSLIIFSLLWQSNPLDYARIP